MPLNWNIEKVKDYKNLQKNPESNTTDALVWGTMFVGIHEITEKNYKEFYARYNLAQRLHGPFLSKTINKKGGLKPYYVTLEDVQRRIGLSTNAGSLTRHQFNKNQLERYYRELI